ncbi:hypothetical protein H4696_000304 [Amycolatopsis lexingtonensis]|uniref:Uncharacterized protein n=1 Tax=Amycolatopsis lexingtonensis TaxID=218822 RepID=A0ABR9HQJ3_9PSEU|nr:hypothetical protein [Amycolatopsis lexingtonensis]MBE1493204.1 hypothetical protein [Amycolatopsis lexingtonensis]
MWRRASLGLVTVVILAATAGCNLGHAATTAPTNSANPSTVPGSGLPAGDESASMPAPGACKLGSRDGQPLPDPNCTPGAVNPTVNQANIDDTICKSGWTKTVRPPTSRTNPMKAASARSYNVPPGEKGEYDHLVSLELGGAPDDPRNLWVEPGTIPNPKDAVENKLNQAVCSGLISLVTAQKAIAADWVTAFDDTGLRVAGGKVCLRDNPAKCVTSRHGDQDGN